MILGSLRINATKHRRPAQAQAQADEGHYSYKVTSPPCTFATGGSAGLTARRMRADGRFSPPCCRWACRATSAASKPATAPCATEPPDAAVLTPDDDGANMWPTLSPCPRSGRCGDVPASPPSPSPFVAVSTSPRLTTDR